MIYAVSDIHGCYDKYMELLQKLGLGPEDTLYALGDVIDRGPDGFKILLDMDSRPNVVGLMGNHEAMAIGALPGLLRCFHQMEDVLTEEEREAAQLWFQNDGAISLMNLFELEGKNRLRVWSYMTSLPLYQVIEVGNHKFVLVHGGLEDFSPSRPLEDYVPDEVLWCRPKPDTAYFPDKTVVLGHTPTQFLYEEAGEWVSMAKIFRRDSFIDIDCGCVFTNGRLGCLCLDTMEEIYI